MRKTKRAITVWVITLALLVGPAAFVALAKGGSHVASRSTLRVVMVDPADTVANYGDVITFSVDTTETTRPFVGLACMQGEDLVYSKSAGIFPSYSFSQTFTLSSAWWPGGAAECTATLYYFTSNGRERRIGTLDFPVAA